MREQRNLNLADEWLKMAKEVQILPKYVIFLPLFEHDSE